MSYKTFREEEMKICMKEQGFYETWNNIIGFNIEDVVIIWDIIQQEIYSQKTSGENKDG